MKNLQGHASHLLRLNLEASARRWHRKKAQAIKTLFVPTVSLEPVAGNYPSYTIVSDLAPCVVNTKDMVEVGNTPVKKSHTSVSLSTLTLSSWLYLPVLLNIPVGQYVEFEGIVHDVRKRHIVSLRYGLQPRVVP